MFKRFIPYFTRPKARRPIRKTSAIVLTVVGLFGMMFAVTMIAAAWGELSWFNRAGWIASMIISLWMLPWTWANFFRERTET